MDSIWDTSKNLKKSARSFQVGVYFILAIRNHTHFLIVSVPF